MYTNLLRELPLLRIYVFVLWGTIYGLHSKVSIPITFTISFILLVIILAIRKNYKLQKLPNQVFLTSLFTYTLVFLLSVSLASYQHGKRITLNTSNSNSAWTIIEIKQALIEKPNTYQSIGKICSEETKTCREVMLYIKKSAVCESVQIGDKIASNFTIQAIPRSKNPHSFDYAQYLFNQGISGSAYLDTIIYLPADINLVNTCKQALEFSRQAILTQLSECIPDLEQLAIAQALLIGHKGTITPELRANFQKSGAMHVLAVSGLHVGIIYLLISQFLFFLPNKSLTKSIFMILGILSYALLTGASPSVMRAALMFSLLRIGIASKRNINIYNILAASACLLTLWNPFIILNVGFQLSYAALLSILYFYKKIYLLYISSNWLIDKFWQLSAVSIAAQIGTFPLTLFYFNQFPNYFLLSNFIAIPLATIIVYLGIATIAMAYFPYMQSILAKGLSIVLKGLIVCLDWIAELPFALSQGWNISLLELIMLYSIILLSMAAISFRKKLIIYLILLNFALLNLVTLYETIKSSYENELNVYYDKTITSLSFREGLNGKVFYSDSIPAYLRQSITQASAHHGIVNQAFYPIKENTITFTKGEFSCALIQDKIPENMCFNELDLVVLAKFNKLELNNLFNQLKAETYVFDGTNNPYLYKEWKRICEERCKSCYFIAEEGAFIQQIN